MEEFDEKKIVSQAGPFSDGVLAPQTIILYRVESEKFTVFFKRVTNKVWSLMSENYREEIWDLSDIQTSSRAKANYIYNREVGQRLKSIELWNKWENSPYNFFKHRQSRH